MDCPSKNLLSQWGLEAQGSERREDEQTRGQAELGAHLLLHQKNVTFPCFTCYTCAGDVISEWTSQLKSFPSVKTSRDVYNKRLYRLLSFCYGLGTGLSILHI